MMYRVIAGVFVYILLFFLQILTFNVHVKARDFVFFLPGINHYCASEALNQMSQVLSTLLHVA